MSGCNGHESRKEKDTKNLKLHISFTMPDFYLFANVNFMPGKYDAVSLRAALRVPVPSP